ncbi:MAG: hypothetical protein AAGF11_40320 [Myxococcota bacterium]
MRCVPQAALAYLVLTSGCAEVGIPEPCAPGEIPPIGQHTLVAAKEKAEEAEAEGTKGDETQSNGDKEGEDGDVAPTDTSPDDASPDDASPDDAVPEDVAPTDPFEAAREDVERSADWLVCVVPDQLPSEQLDAWVERRDLVMDWTENHPTLGYTFNASIMAAIHKDRRFYASMYMNLAYAIGKARYLLAANPVDPVEAEVAGLESVAQYYATFRAVEPKLTARKLKRLMRKKHKGKLREWVLKHMAKG